MSFALKRGHLSAVRVGRDVLAEVPDMTPARFDILFLLHHHTRHLPRALAHSMEQREIRQRLGLSGATISKMLKRLRELGLLLSERAESGDRRLNIITLTEEGLARVRNALGVAFNGHWLATLYWDYIKESTGLRWVRGERSKLREALESSTWELREVARHLGNTSTQIYWLDYEPD